MRTSIPCCRSVLVLFTLVVHVQAGEAFSGFEQVKTRAAQLASTPYKDWSRDLSKSMPKLTYDQYRDIRFNPRKAVWRYDHIPFQMHLFHPGWIQNDQVDVSVVNDGKVSAVRYDRDLFDFGTNEVGKIDADNMRFSGIRFHYPLNRPEYLDELAVFQGATYFRVLAKNLVYGLSARAVAVNCGGPGPEEFPRFREFWVCRPEPKEEHVRIYGLFDSPSLTGAGEFVIRPGAVTVMENRVAIYARTNIAHLGIAPLTSMYWYGKNSAQRFSDFRPEVHDSDGLLMNNGAGEWLWRPLTNEGKFRLCSFADRQPKGFGLLQRDRAFATYEDLEAHYQDRPSAWVTPKGVWGEGAVRLLELPAADEFGDNIVAFWEPKRPLSAGQSAEYAYELRWFHDDPALPQLGRSVATRVADLPDYGRKDKSDKTVTRKFVLDFAWPSVAADAEKGKLNAAVSVQGATLSRPVEQYNPYDRTWRVFFSVTVPAAGQTAELRAFVKRDNQPVTETWIYLWNP
ncbi:MAG TPA: glucan biosynthesis protein G [Kiritimatiellia bacterium]|nr:glucan biosynthesis protein G [Kiritimatiellia bacterium]HPS08866.1 glucan biosynthesis protein G [Kiritimatiellia bacterium]